MRSKAEIVRQLDTMALTAPFTDDEAVSNALGSWRAALRWVLEDPDFAAPLCGWKPIEEAPKDGTKVLVLASLWGFPSGGGITWAVDLSPAVCVYEPRSGAWSVAHNQSPGGVLAYNPTHFMPLPCAPVSNEEDRR